MNREESTVREAIGIRLVPIVATVLALLGSARAMVIVPDDAATLALAAAMATEGETIRIRPGTWDVDRLAISGKSLRLEGLGVLPGDTRIVPPPLPADSIGDRGPALAVQDCASFHLRNVRVEGMQGHPGFPPSHCVGGVGDAGYPAIVVARVTTVEIWDAELAGGPGGAGVPNTGSCPAPGTDGNGAPGLVLEDVGVALLARSLATGGCGNADGASVALDQGTEAHAFDVTLTGSSCGTGLVDLRDGASSYQVLPIFSSARNWHLYE